MLGKKHILGIDIGGTNIKFGLVDSRGNVAETTSVKTGAGVGPAFVINQIIGEANRFFPRIKKIGIACAGEIDQERGIVKISPNLKGFKNVPLKIKLEQKSKIPVVIDNDTNCFTLAEALLGAGRGKRYVVGLTLGTGVGGGFVISGKIYHGRRGAGELGHIVIDPSGPKCGCGNRGCLEQYVSGPAMTRAYYKKKGKMKTPKEIEDESKDKSSPAYQVVKQAGIYLGIGLSSICHCLDPEIIVLGGKVARTKTLYPFARKELDRRLLFQNKKIPVVHAKLGDNAGIIGAALITNTSSPS